MGQRIHLFNKLSTHPKFVGLSFYLATALYIFGMSDNTWLDFRWLFLKTWPGRNKYAIADDPMEDRISGVVDAIQCRLDGTERN